MYYGNSRTEKEVEIEKQIIINMLEQGVEAYASDIPEVKYYDMEEFNEWSRIKWIYKDLLDACKKSDNPIGYIECYNSKALRNAINSEKHKDLFNAMYYISEDLLQMIAEEIWLGENSDFYY